jgi:hypothetical protein
MEKMNKEIAQSLLSNAHNFISSATDYAKSNDSKDWKYAILSLAAGIELVLKARLALEHWALLFEKVDSASAGKLKAGDFNSINFESSIIRLENISNICLSKSLKKNFENIRKIRNKINHYHFDVNKFDVKSLVATGIKGFIEFYNKFLVKSAIGDASFGYGLCNILLEFKEFVSARMDSLRPQLEVSKRPRTWYFYECPYCLQDATVLVENQAKCLFCGHENFFKDIAELISINGRVEVCPSCKKESVILHRSEKDYEYWECIICGFFKGAPQTWVDLDGKQLPHLRY